VLSGNACQRIDESSLEELICTDSIPFNLNCCSKLHVESLAIPIAETIRAIQNHTSVSEMNIR
jgi:ribose-phosphate pyrophosphokinase